MTRMPEERMDDTVVTVFMRWALHDDVVRERARSLLTLAVLLCDDEEVRRFTNETSGDWLDKELVEELLSFAKPEEVAALLSRLGRDVPANVFKAAFDRAVGVLSDIDAISKLVFVASLFLQLHPGAFQLPRPSVDQLLASNDLDHRIAGVRAVRHSLYSSTEVLATITGALLKDVWEEKWTGLSQLLYFLEERGAHATKGADRKVLDDLLNVLARIADSDPETDSQHAASHCIALLRQEELP
jgi:hypothetical protein